MSRRQKKLAKKRAKVFSIDWNIMEHLMRETDKIIAKVVA